MSYTNMTLFIAWILIKIIWLDLDGTSVEDIADIYIRVIKYHKALNDVYFNVIYRQLTQLDIIIDSNYIQYTIFIPRMVILIVYHMT